MVKEVEQTEQEVILENQFQYPFAVFSEFGSFEKVLELLRFLYIYDKRLNLEIFNTEKLLFIAEKTALNERILIPEYSQLRARHVQKYRFQWLWGMKEWLILNGKFEDYIKRLQDFVPDSIINEFWISPNAEKYFPDLGDSKIISLITNFKLINIVVEKKRNSSLKPLKYYQPLIFILESMSEGVDLHELNDIAEPQFSPDSIKDLRHNIRLYLLGKPNKPMGSFYVLGQNISVTRFIEGKTLENTDLEEEQKDQEINLFFSDLFNPNQRLIDRFPDEEKHTISALLSNLRMVGGLAYILFLIENDQLQQPLINRKIAFNTELYNQAHEFFADRYASHSKTPSQLLDLLGIQVPKKMRETWIQDFKNKLALPDSFGLTTHLFHAIATTRRIIGVLNTNQIHFNNTEDIPWNEILTLSDDGIELFFAEFQTIATTENEFEKTVVSLADFIVYISKSKKKFGPTARSLFHMDQNVQKIIFEQILLSLSKAGLNVSNYISRNSEGIQVKLSFVIIFTDYLLSLDKPVNLTDEVMIVRSKSLEYMKPSRSQQSMIENGWQMSSQQFQGAVRKTGEVMGHQGVVEGEKKFVKSQYLARLKLTILEQIIYHFLVSNDIVTPEDGEEFNREVSKIYRILTKRYKDPALTEIWKELMRKDISDQQRIVGIRRELADLYQGRLKPIS